MGVIWGTWRLAGRWGQMELVKKWKLPLSQPLKGCSRSCLEAAPENLVVPCCSQIHALFTGRQTNRQTVRQDRQTYISTDRQTERLSNIQTVRHCCACQFCLQLQMVLQDIRQHTDHTCQLSKGIRHEAMVLS